MIYISNRFEEYLRGDRGGFEPAGDQHGRRGPRLLSERQRRAVGQDRRRETVVAEYNVLLLFGDNLRTSPRRFWPKSCPPAMVPKAYGRAIEARLRTVDDGAAIGGLTGSSCPTRLRRMGNLSRSEPMKRLCVGPVSPPRNRPPQRIVHTACGGGAGSRTPGIPCPCLRLSGGLATRAKWAPPCRAASLPSWTAMTVDAGPN